MEVDEKRLLNRLRKAKESGKLDDWEVCCRRLAEYRATHGHYEDALSAYKEELQVAEMRENAKDIASANRMIGEMLCTLGQFKTALDYVNKYLSYAKSEKDTVEEQRAWATIGRTYFCWAVELQQASVPNSSQTLSNKVLKDCRKAYMKSLYICEQELRGVGNRERQEMKARLFFNLGLACEVEEELEEALGYIEKAIIICKQETLYEDLHRCYISLSSIYLKQNKLTDSLRVLDKALDVAKKLPNATELSVLALTHKADVYFSMGNYPGARATLKRAYKMKTPNVDDKAAVETNLRRALFLCELESKLASIPKDNLSERRNLYEKLGDACCSVKNYKHAIQCYQNMLECSQQLGQTEKDLQPCYVSLSQTYRDNKQYGLALLYARKELEVSRNIPKEAARTHIGIGELLEMTKAPYSEVSEEYLAALRYAKDANNVALQASALSRLAAVQRENGKIDLALETERELGSLDTHDSDDSMSDQEDSPTFGVNLSDLSDSDEEVSRHRQPRTGFKVTRNEKGETPLHVAAIRGDVERAKRLIGLGHPVKERDLAGWTPLHEAANHGHLPMAKILVEAGADINDPGGRDCGGVTPLHDAASCGHFSVVDYFLEHGALVASLTDSNETPLDCLRGWRDRVDALDDDSQIEYEQLEKKLSEALSKSGFDRPKKLKQNLKANDANSLDAHDQLGSCFDLRRTTDCNTSPRRSRWRSASPVSVRSLTPESSPNANEFHRKPSPKRSVSDYKSAMEAIRKRPVPQPQSKPHITAPLVNENDYVGDWLEDDLGIKANNKKMKRKVTEWLERDNVRVQKSAEPFDPIVSPEREGLAVPACTEPASKRSKIQTSLKDAGFEATIVVPNSPERVVAPPEEEYFNIMSPPMTSVSGHRVVKLRVEVGQHTLLIFVDSAKSEELKVRWLAEEAAKRYCDLEGIEPQLILKTRDGAHISFSDPLSVVFDEDLIGIVQCWKVASLPDRYKDACNSTPCKREFSYCGYVTGPDKAILSRLEACIYSRVLDLGYMALNADEVNPVLLSLKHEKNLQAVDLSGNILGDDGLEMLSRCMEHCSIENINISCNNITAAGFNKFSDCLQTYNSERLSWIKSIDISYNPLGDSAKATIEKLRSYLPNLTNLRTDNSDFPK